MSKDSNQFIVAVALYGMSKNLKLTLPSIKHRIFKVLNESNVLYDVFWHTLIMDEIHQSRLDQEDGFINPYDVELISPCRFALSDQDEIQKQEFEKFRLARKLTKEFVYFSTHHKLYDNWNDNYNSTRNILGAFYTLNSLYNMISTYSIKSGIQYDAILVIRPDTAMIKDIDLPLYMNNIKNNTKHNEFIIWIPDFAHNAGYNDRAAYGNVAAMERYMRRGLFYRDQYQNDTNGEQFLKYILTKYNITVKKSAMRFLRVRNNNLIAKYDLNTTLINVRKNEPDFLNYRSQDMHHLSSSC